MDRGLLTVGSVFLSLGAFFGLVLFAFEVFRKDFPRILGFIHPTLALTGFLMIVARHFITGPLPYMDWGLLSLLASAVFGGLLLVRGFGGRKMLRILTVAHGIFGLAGLGLILWQVSVSYHVNL